MITESKYKPEYESRFSLGGKLYIAIEKPTMSCAQCVFKDDTSGCFKAPSCVPTGRYDGRMVYFVRNEK